MHLTKNKLTAVLLVGLFSTTFSTLTSASENISVNVCKYIKEDNQRVLREYLVGNKVKLNKVYQNFSCNGDSLLRFAILHNANKSGKYLSKRLSTKRLDQAESDGKTIMEWADSIQKSDSKTIALINKRLGK